MGGYGSRIPRENLGISHIPQNFLDLSRIPQHAHSLLFLYCIFLRLFIFSLRNNTSKMPYSSIVERVSKIYDRLPFKYVTPWFNSEFKISCMISLLIICLQIRDSSLKIKTAKCCLLLAILCFWNSHWGYSTSLFLLLNRSC